MSSSELVAQTVQAVALSAVSNTLAQIISSYKDDTSFSLNLTQILKFCLYTALNTPPNFIWQLFLEDQFPTFPKSSPPPPSEKPKPKAAESKPLPNFLNVAKKFLLDQTVSAVFNTLQFVAFMAYFNNMDNSGALKANSWTPIRKEMSQKFWPLLKDGYKLWPVFSLVSFLWIPVEKRILAGGAVGIGWGIYLSLIADK